MQDSKRGVEIADKRREDVIDSNCRWKEKEAGNAAGLYKEKKKRREREKKTKKGNKEEKNVIYSKRGIDSQHCSIAALCEYFFLFFNPAE